MNLDMTQEKLMLLLYISPLLFAQSIFLFLNAKKKGANAWFWGIWGLIQTPMPTKLIPKMIKIHIHFGPFVFSCLMQLTNADTAKMKYRTMKGASSAQGISVSVMMTASFSYETALQQINNRIIKASVFGSSPICPKTTHWLLFSSH